MLSQHSSKFSASFNFLAVCDSSLVHHRLLSHSLSLSQQSQCFMKKILSIPTLLVCAQITNQLFSSQQPSVLLNWIFERKIYWKDSSIDFSLHQLSSLISPLLLITCTRLTFIFTKSDTSRMYFSPVIFNARLIFYIQNSFLVNKCVMIK